MKTIVKCLCFLLICTQVLAGAFSDNPRLSVDGRLNVAKVSAGDGALTEVLQTGFEWQILRHQCDTMYPTLAGVIQSARNSVGQCQNAESEIQILVRMSHMAQEMAAANDGKVQWGTIVDRCSKSRPRCIDDMHSLALYAAKYSGDWLLDDLARFF